MLNGQCQVARFGHAQHGAARVRDTYGSRQLAPLPSSRNRERRLFYSPAHDSDHALARSVIFSPALAIMAHGTWERGHRYRFTDGDLATVSAATLDLVRLAIRYFKIGKASCYAYL
jgi:aryl-phospho-beta-D-glucosidase BglC (GH1 family)